MDEFKISKPRVVVATPKSSPEDTTTFEYIKDYGPECKFITNNFEKLTKIYNQELDYAKSDGVDCLIFTHDDVMFRENPIYKLDAYLFKDYDLVGVAGASKITLQSPALWHLMGGGFGSLNIHGLVEHKVHGIRNSTYFGLYPHRALIIDGVFMALNRKGIEQARFDENIPSKFHFYDLDFSLSCHKQGLRVGVGDVKICHLSPGLRAFTDEWKQGEQYFLQKYE